MLKYKYTIVLKCKYTIVLECKYAFLLHRIETLCCRPPPSLPSSDGFSKKCKFICQYSLHSFVNWKRSLCREELFFVKLRQSTRNTTQYLVIIAYCIKEAMWRKKPFTLYSAHFLLHNCTAHASLYNRDRIVQCKLYFAFYTLHFVYCQTHTPTV